MSTPRGPVSGTSGSPLITRRRLAGLGLGLIGTSLLAACGGANPTVAPAAVATTAPAASASSAPAASASAAPAAGATPAASSAPAASPVVNRPTDSGELKIGLSNEPTNIDPHQTSALISSVIMVDVLDTLIVSLADQRLVPGLATKWEYNAEGTQLTLTLRSGVKFHDGTPFNAAAMKKSFDRMVDPATKSGLAGSLLGPYKGSEAVDDTTLRFTLGTSFAPLLGNLARANTAPISPQSIDKFGLDVAKNLVGTGPFIFKEWIPKDHLTLERNPDYKWAPDFFGFNGTPVVPRITWRFIAEEATRLATLRNGESNIIEGFPPAFVKQFTADSAYAIDIKTNPGLPFSFMVNTQKAPCDQLEVRQALLYGIDKDSISQTLNFGVYPPARGPLSPVTPTYSADVEKMYPYDQNKAKSLLEGAGWVAGSDGIRAKNGQRLQLEFWTLSDVVAYQNIAQAFQAQMKAIGIDLKIVTLARTAWGDGVHEGKHHLTTQIFSLPDPSVLSTNFHSKNITQPGSARGFNWSRYANPDLDKLLDDGDKTLDVEKRKQIYADAQKLIMDQALLVPVYVLHQVFGRAAAVQDISYVVGGLPMLYSATVKK